MARKIFAFVIVALLIVSIVGSAVIVAVGA